MKFDFFTIWFLISGLVITRLYLKNKEYKEKTGEVLEHVNDVWDKEYKQLIQVYGSVNEFLECHKKDFDIIRSYVVTMYAQLSIINREYTFKTDTLLSVQESKITKKDIFTAINNIKMDLNTQTNDLLKEIDHFIINEEEAHQNNKIMRDILDNINEKYKKEDLYKED